jgi:PRC-barrel domain
VDSLESDPVEPVDETPVPEPAADPALTKTAPLIGHRNLAERQGRQLVDRDGERIGKLEHVYFDVESDEPQFGTVKEGLFGRHLALVPLAGVTIGPDSLQVPISKEQIRLAPKIEPGDLSQADESRLYHHYQLNYRSTEKAAADSYDGNSRPPSRSGCTVAACTPSLVQPRGVESGRRRVAGFDHGDSEMR